MAVVLSPAATEIPADPIIDASVAEQVRAARSGSAEAFARLYDAHAPRVYAVCVGLTGNRAAAAELLQDTFVKAWERLATYRGDAALATWLHRIALNEFLQQERSHRRRTIRVMPDGDRRGTTTDRAAALELAPSPAGDPSLSIDLEQAIARLPDGARRVFVLHDIAGYQHAEIAAHLGLAEGTCKAHLFRARRLLRGMLDR